MNKILRVILHVKNDELHIPLLGSSEMYSELGLLKFDDIYDYCLLKFIHWCFNVRFDMFDTFFIPLMPHHHHLVRDFKLNYPPTRIEIHRQSALFQCVRVFNCFFNNNLFNFQMSSFGLKKQFKEYVLNGYRAV